jgi:Xaa-Pro aminopeptidase
MFERRIKNIKSSLEEHEIEALLITSSYNIAYLTGIHAFSIEEREARILVTTKNIYLFTDARYTEMVKKASPFVKLVEINSKKPFLQSLASILKNERIKSLGFEEKNITYKEILQNIGTVPTEGIIENYRLIKNQKEISSIKKACHLSDMAFEFIKNNVRLNDSEIDVKIKLENYIRSHGGDLSFSSIVAFGKNSAIPHHMSTSYKLQPKACILLDFGAKIEGYCSDMTRVIFIGKPSDKQLKMYNAVKETQEVAIDYLRTHMKKGLEMKEVAKLANSHLEALGFSDVPHSLGHGVGLQVHEEPSINPYSKEKPIPGMIITIEPGVYIPNLSGVRIEDTALITKDSIELLTKSPKGLTVI